MENDLGDHSFPPEQGAMIQQLGEAQIPPWKDGAGLGGVPSHGAILLLLSKNLTSMEKCFQVDLTELQILKAYKADEDGPKGMLYIHALLA